VNKISPKSILHSKWTKTEVQNKEKHFVVTVVKFDEQSKVIKCVIESIMGNNEYEIDWRELKNKKMWCIGWK
jgi:tryptophan-rich hypothetical protein